MSDEEGAKSPGHGQLLGIAVRRRREELGLTQEELAELVGGEVDGNYITHLETGRRVRLPEQPLFGRIAAALRLRQIDLLVSSGMITEPLPQPGAVRDPFPKDTPHAEVVRRLRGLTDDQALMLASLAEWVRNPPVVDIPRLLREAIEVTR